MSEIEKVKKGSVMGETLRELANFAPENQAECNSGNPDDADLVHLHKELPTPAEEPKPDDSELIHLLKHLPVTKDDILNGRSEEKIKTYQAQLQEEKNRLPIPADMG